MRVLFGQVKLGFIPETIVDDTAAVVRDQQWKASISTDVRTREAWKGIGHTEKIGTKLPILRL